MDSDAKSLQTAEDLTAVTGPDEQRIKKEIQREWAEENASGLSAIAIRNPHLIIVIFLIITLLGGLSLFLLPKDLLPSANLPAVQILSFYSGMPVEHVEQDLSYMFERYTGQAVGIERQESRSLTGVSIVKNYFNSDVELSSAIAQTSSMVMSVLRKLPPGTQPPLILPFDPMAAVPLALAAVSGDHSESELQDIGRYYVSNAIQSVPGAMAPTVMGGQLRSAITYLDPKKLSEYNFSAVGVLNDLLKENTFVPAGDIKVGDIDYQILSNGLVDQMGDMNRYALRSQNGVIVRLKDVGEAKDAHAIQTNVVMVNGKRQVYVPIYREPGANTLKIIDEVKASLSTLEKSLKGYKIELVADQTLFIRKAIDSITHEALIGGGLAALMVLLFLGSPRATVAILLSLPLSLFSAFLGLKASGQTINAMTLGGLALSIGVLVDNSIVVIENIMNKLSRGVPPITASLDGAREVGMPVLASTLATLVVFFPVVFLSGIVKILFSALAKAVIFAMIGSYFAAMTVIPLFTSRFLKTNPKSPGGLIGIVQSGVTKLTHAYQSLLQKVLQRRIPVLISTVLVLMVVGISLAPRIGTELFPRADSGGLMLDVRGPSGLRIEKSTELAQKIETKLREWIPASDLKMIVTNAGVYYGFPAAFTPNSGTQDMFFNVELTEDRKNTSQYYAKIIRENLPKEFPNTEFGIELGGLLTSALNGGLRSPIDVQIMGINHEQSHEIASTLASRLTKLPGAVDVRVQQRIDAPQIKLIVDREKANVLGLNPDAVVRNVVSAVSGSSTFNPAIWIDPKTGIDYPFGVQFKETEIESFDKLLEVPITSDLQKRSVPLNRIASMVQSKGPSEINHVNLKPVVDIYLDAQGRDIGSLSAEVQKVINDSHLPPGYTAEIRGEVSEMKKSVRLLGGGFVLAAILVYLIFVVQFRSFLLPAIIMVTVPMGIVGIIVMLSLTHTYFSIQAAIGAIFMIGIAVANGVLLIEFILHRSKEISNFDEAIITGAGERLRPIMMTSLASMLGLVPMAIGLGHGSEANIPLGRAVIGGQLLSTTLTLFIVPVLFRIFFKAKTHLSPESLKPVG